MQNLHQGVFLGMWTQLHNKLYRYVKVNFRMCKYEGLSVKYEDKVNTEANTFNNMELFLFVLLRTIWQFKYEFSFPYVNTEIKY